MFKRILIANRGEIALRIIRACHELGIETVAVYSTSDRHSLHVKAATHAVCIGEGPSHKSYMNSARILSAAEITGADAIHPGYGFLSENDQFATMCETSGFHFIGPKASTIREMGNKISARDVMKSLGIHPVPGSDNAITDHTQLQKWATDIGYPVIIKAASCGGGRGMRIVHTSEQLEHAFQEAQLEAEKTSKDPSCYIEKYIQEPRHIELQVLADHNGKVLILGERDCSIQRRYQKIIEEAPALDINPQQLAQLKEKAAQACQKIGYFGAGTLEFLYDGQNFYFIEMNTRLQVEHPVTEMTTGIDIVSWQIKIASGMHLDIDPADLNPQGHAIECRLLAEDPLTGTPSPGKITQLILPGGPGIRLDTHIYPNFVISHEYDPLIAKIIAHGSDRKQAISRMINALKELSIEGISTNRDALICILNQSWFKNQKIHTHSLTNNMETLKNEITT